MYQQGKYLRDHKKTISMWSEKVLVSIVSSVKSLQLMMKQNLLQNIAFSRVNCDRATILSRYPECFTFLSPAARIFSANLFEIQIVFGVRRVLLFFRVLFYSSKVYSRQSGSFASSLITHSSLPNRHFYLKTLETTAIGRQNWFCCARNSRRKVS